jgi:excisionase family DNA binding protein
MELTNRIERARAREELLTVEEATRFFRVSKPTLLGALQRGELPAFKIGRQWRIFKYPPKEGLISDADPSRIFGATLENAGKNR